MSGHGGARRNAGRPKLRPKERREPVNYTMSPEVLRIFRKAVPVGHRARFIEEAILLKLELRQTADP